MKRLTLISMYLLSGVFCFATGTIRFKTTLNTKLLPALFPLDKAVFWTNLYYSDSVSLLSCHTPDPSPTKMVSSNADFFTIRASSGDGRITKWLNGKWVPTAMEYSYRLTSIQPTQTKTICGYPCYKVTYSNNGNKLTSTGWITDKLASRQGIQMIQGMKGALLGYENEQEATYAVSVGAVLPSNWLTIYQKMQSAAGKQPLKSFSAAKGETKPVEVGKSFPGFSMQDVNGTIWNNSKLSGRTSLFIIWADLEPVYFPNGEHSESDFELLRQLQALPIKKGNIQVIAPTFTGRNELLARHPESTSFHSIRVVPDAETWMSDQVKIRKYPTIVVVDKKGLVTHRFEFTHGSEEYAKLKQLILSL